MAARRTKVRKRPLQSRSRATLDAIVEAATQVLVEQGYERATTNRIAARAGVSIGSVYQYFPSKDAIIRELFERRSDAMRERILRRFAELTNAPPHVLLRELIQVLIDRRLEAPELYHVLRAHVPLVGGLPRVYADLEEITRLVAGFLTAQGLTLRAASAERAAFFAVNSVVWTIEHAFATRPHWLDEGLADELAEVVHLQLFGKPFPPAAPPPRRSSR